MWYVPLDIEGNHCNAVFRSEEFAIDVNRHQKAFIWRDKGASKWQWRVFDGPPASNRADRSDVWEGTAYSAEKARYLVQKNLERVLPPLPLFSACLDRTRAAEGPVPGLVSGEVH